MYFILSVNNLLTDLFLEQKKSCFVQQILFWSPDPSIIHNSIESNLAKSILYQPLRSIFLHCLQHMVKYLLLWTTHDHGTSDQHVNIRRFLLLLFHIHLLCYFLLSLFFSELANILKCVIAPSFLHLHTEHTQ